MYRLEAKMIKCPKCDSNDVVKHGTRKTQNRGLVQKYQCKNCNYKFSNPEGWRMRSDPEYIDYALKLYSKGLSLRGVVEQLIKKYKIKVAHQTVMHWVNDFTIQKEEKEEFKFVIEGKDFNISFRTDMEREELLVLINKLMKRHPIAKKSSPIQALAIN